MKEKLDADKILQSIIELRKSQEKTDEQFKKTDEQIRKSQAKTDEQIRKSQAKTDEQFKKTDEQIRKSQAKTDEQIRKSQAKTDEQMKKTDEQMKKTDEQMKRTDERLDKLAQRYGNSERNKGVITEYEFEKAFRKVELVVDGVKYDNINDNVKDPQIAEYDLVLTNGSQVLVVEVKDIAHLQDVAKFVEQLSKYKKAFPQYLGHKVKGAIASRKINRRVKKEIFKHKLLAIEKVDELTVESA